MMKSNLIVMLTHNDKTVHNALEVFESCKHLPVQFWGFKDVGLSPIEMKSLTLEMKEAGKVTFLEVVSYTKEACFDGAKLAANCGFDYLLGTIYYKEVIEYVRTTNLKYFPFVGQVNESPSVLEGTLEEMLAQEQIYSRLGVNGTDFLGYRYNGGDPEELIRQYIAKAQLPTVLAGSIGSDDRIRFALSVNPWSFTMGSALFEKKFVANGTFRDNLEYVINFLETN
jgi:hypothetical protein